MTLSSIAGNEIVRLCFSDIQVVEEYLLDTYRELPHENGSISRPNLESKIKLVESILSKLKERQS